MGRSHVVAILVGFTVFVLVHSASVAWALSEERWTDPTPYGLFFNDYDPNFYTGFVPRVQRASRIKVHLGRGNQLRIRMVLPDEAIDHYLTDQVARHDLYQEVIDKKIITLTSNMAWEEYHARFEQAALREKASKKSKLSAKKWRALNVEAIDALNPERLKILWDLAHLDPPPPRIGLTE
jgi:hypothetical protein